MRIKYVTQPGLLVLLANQTGAQNTPSTPEYVRTSVSGTMLFSYEAYKLQSGTQFSAVPQCSSDLLMLDAASRASAVAWTSGTLSERTNGAVSTASAPEVTPDGSSNVASHLEVVGYSSTSVLPAQTGAVPLAANLGLFNSFNWRDPTAMAAAEAQITRLAFTVTDDLGQGVASLMTSVRFVGVPYYLPGLWTYSKPSCFTTDIFTKSIGPYAAWITSCRTFCACSCTLTLNSDPFEHDAPYSIAHDPNPFRVICDPELAHFSISRAWTLVVAQTTI